MRIVLLAFKGLVTKSACCTICDDYAVNAKKIWMNSNWFYATTYAVWDDEGKVTQRSPPDNLPQLPRINNQSKALTKEVTEKVSKSVHRYVYLALTFQVLTESCMAGNSASIVMLSKSLGVHSMYW